MGNCASASKRAAQACPPSIRDREIVHVTPVIVSKLRNGDIVLTKGDRGFLVHRLVVTRPDKNFFITRGDCGDQDDAPVRADQILGQVVAKEIHVGTKIVRTKLTGFSGTLLLCAARGRSLAGKLLNLVRLRQPRATPPGSKRQSVRDSVPGGEDAGSCSQHACDDAQRETLDCGEPEQFVSGGAARP